MLTKVRVGASVEQCSCKCNVVSTTRNDQRRVAVVRVRLKRVRTGSPLQESADAGELT
jgi:translation elongation factor P/translation initiation factor 5A